MIKTNAGGLVRPLKKVSRLPELIAQAQAQIRTGNLEARTEPDAINETGAFITMELNLATAAPGIAPFITVPGGYALYYLTEGSDAGGRVSLKGAGEWTDMAPGDFFDGYFTSLKVERSPNSSTSGKARFLVITAPNVAAGTTRLASANPSFNGAVVGPGGAATQAAASAAGNIPTAATDGISIEGARGLRTIISCDATRTLIGAGTARYWHYNARSLPDGTAARARWALLKALRYELDADDAGVRDLQLPDEILEVKEGRLYVECKSITTSAGNLTVTMEKF